MNGRAVAGKTPAIQQDNLLYLPTQIRFLIGGERVTCHGSNLHDALGRTNTELHFRRNLNFVFDTRLAVFYATLHNATSNCDDFRSWLNFSIVHGTFCFSHSISRIWHAKLTIFCCFHKKINYASFDFRSFYTCQLSRLRRESHASGLKTSISRRLTLAG